MKLSQGVEWGVHCAVLMAQAPDGVSLSRHVLATHYGLPEMYLAKHLQAMAKAGLLQATPGPKGGFRLARPAGRITVLEIVEAIEGTAAPFICQEIRTRGTGGLSAEECTGPCSVSAVMANAHRAWRSSLASVTVADIEAGLPQSVRERGAARMLPSGG